VGYTFAGFINPRAAASALRTYRENFTATPFGAGAPRAMLGINVSVGETEEEGERGITPSFLGAIIRPSFPPLRKRIVILVAPSGQNRHALSAGNGRASSPAVLKGSRQRSRK
jgi:hypothetical protein